MFIILRYQVLEEMKITSGTGGLRTQTTETNQAVAKESCFAKAGFQLSVL